MWEIYNHKKCFRDKRIKKEQEKNNTKQATILK